MFRNVVLPAIIGLVLGVACGLTVKYVQKKHTFASPTTEAINAEGKYLPMVRLHNAKGEFFCSGVVIADNYVLTAGHCLVDETEIQVRTDKGDLVKEAISKHFKLASDGRIDLGVIEGDFLAFNRAEVDVKAGAVLMNVVSGQRMPGSIFACGYPQGGEDFCSPLTGLIQFSFDIAAQGYLYPGMSGGPVINGLTGHVFAVNSAVFEGPGVLVVPLISLWETLGIPLPKTNNGGI